MSSLGTQRDRGGQRTPSRPSHKTQWQLLHIRQVRLAWQSGPGQLTATTEADVAVAEAAACTAGSGARDVMEELSAYEAGSQGEVTERSCDATPQELQCCEGKQTEGGSMLRSSCCTKYS